MLANNDKVWSSCFTGEPRLWLALKLPRLSHVLVRGSIAHLKEQRRINREGQLTVTTEIVEDWSRRYQSVCYCGKVEMAYTFSKEDPKRPVVLRRKVLANSTVALHPATDRVQKGPCDLGIPLDDKLRAQALYYGRDKVEGTGRDGDVFQTRVREPTSVARSQMGSAGAECSAASAAS